jgi:hypothetical protein
MLRKKMAKNGTGARPGFNWRGEEITRIEGFSDAVFAFATTLLIVSLEVPHTFDELLTTMRGFGAFAICFALLMIVWYRQYLFFRRYGLQDGLTLVLNSVLLFLILFYVYPLKFLFTMVVGSIASGGQEVPQVGGHAVLMITNEQLPTLFVVYGAGYAAISLVLGLMFLGAYGGRKELALSPIERFDTLNMAGDSFINMGVGIVSMLVAVIDGPRYCSWAGLLYPILLIPSLTIYHALQGARRRRLEVSGAPQPHWA